MQSDWKKEKKKKKKMENTFTRSKPSRRSENMHNNNNQFLWTTRPLWCPLSSTGSQFWFGSLNQSAQGNLSTRSLDSRVSQRETNAHFNGKIGPLRKTFHSSNSFLKSRPAWFALRCYQAASWTPTMLLYKVASRAWHKWGLCKWILVL